MSTDLIKSKKFWIKGLFVTVVVALSIIALGYSLLDAKHSQEIEYLNKRTSLQLNVEKERVKNWLDKMENVGADFVNAEPIRTFVVALSDNDAMEKNKKYLEEERDYIQTIVDGFLYQNSFEKVSLITGTGETFVYSGFDGQMNELQKQKILEVIATSRLSYLPVKQENGGLMLEIFKPIYGFIVDDLPVAVLYMSIKLDKDFIKLISEDLPVEKSEKIVVWQYNGDEFNVIEYDDLLGILNLKKFSGYNMGFNFDKPKNAFVNTVKVPGSPLFITLESPKADALRVYNEYRESLQVVVGLLIVTFIAMLWAAFAKIVLKNYKKELKYKEKIEKQSEKTVQALVKTIELRDPYLAGHYSLVKDTALKIANEMGLSKDEKSTIKYSALLAGIGKVAIPKHILTKPEKLTKEEQEIMFSHVTFAEEILEEIEFDLPIKDTVSQMYERLDGSGYPRKLQSIEISKLARILAICDVFCALCSPRSYREAKTPQKALEIMQRDIVKFDSEVLSVLYKVINAK